MSDDYLWEKRGPPDPEVQALEQALAAFAYEGEAPAMPAARPSVSGWAVAAVAACLALTFALGLRYDAPGTAGPTEGWNYTTADGRERTLPVGGWLATGENEKAQLTVADIGSLELQPGSKLRLVRTDADQHRLHLAHGRLHAKVTAPPRLFVVETPSADAVDLGCEYTLVMGEDGAGHLAVFTGRVALERTGRSTVGGAVTVPYDADCAIYRSRGPGTPYFRDASKAFRDAVARFDREQDVASARWLAQHARARDTLTLWHLLPQTKGPTRAAVYDAIREHAELPSGITREATLALDEIALAEWWEELYWSVFYPGE